MTEDTPPATAEQRPQQQQPTTDVDPLLAAYRHDVHKLQGRAHTAAADTVVGVRVNETVPRGADADAALLSRPRGDPEQTVANHCLPSRLSLLTGAPTRQTNIDEAAIQTAIRDLIRIEDPAAAHRAWLDSWVATLYNESLYYPYTSLKYHVLLTAALLANYRAGAGFTDLQLVVDDPDREPVPHRTILATDVLALRLTHDTDEPGARLGPRPARSFADVWSRLPEQPLPVDDLRECRLLDAQLRRIRSWSTALQYIEEFLATTGLADGLPEGVADSGGGANEV
jgi:hypothetical protein